MVKGKMDEMDIDMYEKLMNIVNKKKKTGEEFATWAKKSKNEAPKRSKESTGKELTSNSGKSLNKVI